MDPALPGAYTDYLNMSIQDMICFSSVIKDTGGTMDNRTNISATDFALIQKLRERREQLGLSQTEAAQLLTQGGVRMSQAAVSRIEKGERALTVGEAQCYAHILHTSLEGLLRSDEVDEVIADSRALIRAMEASRNSAIKALNEHWGQITRLQEVADRARKLLAEGALSTPQTQKLEEHFFLPAYLELPQHDKEAELRVARALDTLESTTINEALVIANEDPIKQ